MIISKIEKSKHKQERVLVYFEGGDLLKITSSELLQFGLYSGMDLPDDIVIQLKESSRKSEAKIYAARLASSRIISRKELEKRLEKKGSTREESAEIADRMEELGVVDDKTYAEIIARHYSSMNYGQERIREELYRRGIPKDLWDWTFSRLPNPKEGIHRFVTSKTKGAPMSAETCQKVFNALLRRGYHRNDIRDVLNHMGQNIIDE